LKKWEKAVRRKNWKATSNSRLCSKHFTEDSYVPGLSKRVLKKHAVPTLFDFSSVKRKKRSKDCKVFF
jgi:hypothetical protein